MSQRLSLPIDDCIFNAGYLSARYKQEWGFQHFGVDLKSKSGYTVVKALGEGVVHSCGPDAPVLTGAGSRCGNCIVLIYKDVERNDGKVCDLACRLFHLSSISVKAGQKVKRGDTLGRYGNTGAYTSGAHLHVEFDTDASQAYAAWSPSVSSSGWVIKRGYADTCVDPSKVWFEGAGQSMTSPYTGWYEPKDVNLPDIDEGRGELEEHVCAYCEEMRKQYDDLSDSYDALDREHEALKEQHEALVDGLEGLMKIARGE